MGDASGQPLHGLSSAYEEFLRVPDFRRAQGRKHTIASVLTIDTLASLSGFESGIGAAQFARALTQTELKKLGAWFNPKTEKYEPPSKSVIYRVREKADPAAMESVLKSISLVYASAQHRHCACRRWQAPPGRESQRGRPFRNRNSGCA